MNDNVNDSNDDNSYDIDYHQKSGGWQERLKNFFNDPQKRRKIFILFGVLTVALFGLGLFFLTNENGFFPGLEKISSNKEGNKAPEPTFPAPLDGVMAPAGAINRHPLAVIIENHVDARPQAGLSKASVVYEAIAEGGITRYMAIFGTNEADKVGPIRSARTYFVDWAKGFDAFMAHVGGNIDALDQIKIDKVLDLDQFRFPNPYWRERNRSVASEHTMYSSTNKLWQQAKENGYDDSNNFPIYKFKDDAAAELRPKSQKISINFSQDQYNVVFQYDNATNSYKRFLAGTKDTDQLDNSQLAPKNIAIMTMGRQPITTRINESGYSMDTLGSGQARIFVDGKEIKGTWKKPNKTDREIFYDDKGQEVIFNQGQLWISVVHPEAEVKVE